MKAEQTLMLRALHGLEEIPPGFNYQRFRSLKQTLRIKRLKAVRKSWPILDQLLKDDFESCFDSYAKIHGCPAYHGGLFDGRMFVRFLRRRRLLPDHLEQRAHPNHIAEPEQRAHPDHLAELDQRAQQVLLKQLASFDGEFRISGRRLMRRTELERWFYKLVLIWRRP